MSHGAAVQVRTVPRLHALTARRRQQKPGAAAAALLMDFQSTSRR